MTPSPAPRRPDDAPDRPRCAEETGAPDVEEVGTPHGPARVHLRRAPDARGLVMLGHGAGGGVTADDLTLAADVAHRLGLTVALVEQPYRVAGRRAPAPAKQLDTAWVAVARWLRSEGVPGGTGPALVVGGRSSGARVACRTAVEVGAAAALCLAFPLRPPGRADRPSRLPELDAAGVPTLVVQGRRDPFGVPEPGPGRQVVLVDGDHRLAKDHEVIRAALTSWFEEVLAR